MVDIDCLHPIRAPSTVSPTPKSHNQTYQSRAKSWEYILIHHNDAIDYNPAGLKYYAVHIVYRLQRRDVYLGAFKAFLGLLFDVS